MTAERDAGPARRIADELGADIRAGRLVPGFKLPAVREIAQQYGVSRNTAAKAITHLRAEGLVISRFGSGTYVRQRHERRLVGPHRYSRAKWAVTTVEAHTPERDGQPVIQQGTQQQTVQRVPADEDVARELGVAVGAEVIERDRTVYRDGQPTHTMTSWYRVEDAGGTAIEDPRPGIAGPGGGFAILTERGLAPEQMTERLFARTATPDEAERLGLTPNEPVVELHRTTRAAGGRVIEYAVGVHAASRFEWQYTFDIPE